MKNKQHLKSFEGDLFYIDIIWTTGDKPAMFEVRATNADTDVTTTITNQSVIVRMITDAKKTPSYMKEEIWNCTSADADALAKKIIPLLSQESNFQQLEEFLESNIKNGGWDSEDTFDDELAFDENDLDDDPLFDDEETKEDQF